jgi:aminoglycoside phosphotransferase (APT) family kinase protein
MSGLPEGVTEWIEATAGGSISRLERHVARREAWVVDVTREDGSRGEYFLRLDRVAKARGEHAFSVARETRVLEALAGTKVLVPSIHGFSEEHQCALQERVPGRSDLQNVAPEQQRPVFEHFIDLVAELHALPARELGLDDFPWPTTPEDHALGEVRTLQKMLAARNRAARPEPLATFGAAWLGRNVPATVDRTVLVQGDTGPANFLFEGDRVTAIVDWEWAHMGDPMEDLGNITAREFFHPSGNLAPLFRRYAERSGHDVSLDSVRYYRVQQFVRSVIGLVLVTDPLDPKGPAAMNWGYRVVCQRALCDALALAMGSELVRCPLPEAARSAIDAGLGEVAVRVLEDDVAPASEAGWRRSQVEGAAALTACVAREQRFGSALERAGCDELEALLGTRPADLAGGLAALDAAIAAGDAPDEAATLRFLARRASQTEALYEPVVRPFARREFSPIE